MRLPFYKYQATGNDFVIINQLQVPYIKEPEQDTVARICDRHFGVGADGLILLESTTDADFKMSYYNADGKLSTMCGNGGRAITHLAHYLKVFVDQCTFLAADGPHDAKVNDDGDVSLQMRNVEHVSRVGDDFVLDTGSPHYVSLREAVSEMDVCSEARLIRYNDEYGEVGINVDFIEAADDGLRVRTYERGVEGETLSCGTGATAAALVASRAFRQYKGKTTLPVITRGGELTVQWAEERGQFTNIWLSGPVTKVYEGVYDL